MRADQARAHASYCFARAKAAPNAVSRKRWAMEGADWLELERGAERDIEKLDAAFAGFSALLHEKRSFG